MGLLGQNRQKTRSPAENGGEENTSGTYRKTETHSRNLDHVELKN